MDNYPPRYTEIFPEEDSPESNLIKEKRYEVFKEENGMLHGWYDCSVIEYEKYSEDKRRIIEPDKISAEELDELRSFEFYPHSDKSLKVLGEDYEGCHFNKNDIKRLIYLLTKYLI